MSALQQTADAHQTSTDPPEGSAQCVRPSNEKLRRLVAETAGYLGREAGETVPRSEVKRQATANGYSDEEFWTLINAADCDESSELVVPERDGSILGDTFAAGGPTPDSTTTDFEKWLESKHEDRFKEPDDEGTQFPPEHAFSHKAERTKYGRSNDVDRYFVQNTDKFTTVLLTFVTAPNPSPVAQAQRFFPSEVTRKIRTTLKKHDLWDDCAVVKLRAPRGPRADSTQPVTHGHAAIWVPGHVDRERFVPIVEKHVEEVEGATEENHPLDKALSVRHQVSDEVGSPEGVGDDHGDTTALPIEVGNNLPLLGCHTDARDAPDYVTEWCAMMAGGTDGDPTTNGIGRWQPQGNFKQYADEMDE